MLCKYMYVVHKQGRIQKHFLWGHDFIHILNLELMIFEIIVDLK